jgi:hypothetical protein
VEFIMLNPKQFPISLQPIARLIKSGRMDEARKLLRPILEADPDNADAWYLVSLTTNQMAQRAEALERALKINCQHALARQALVDLHAVDNILSAAIPAPVPQARPTKLQPQSPARKPKQAWYHRRETQLQLAGTALIAVIILVAFAVITRPHPYILPGRLVFETNDPDDIYILASMNAGPKNLTPDENGRAFSPALSPDGSKIAFVWGEHGSSYLFTMNVDGTNIQQRSVDGMFLDNPAWSPDGSQIVYAKTQSEYRSEVYIMNADGTNDHRVTRLSASSDMPDWSPDGTQIAFISSADKYTRDVFVMNVDGANVRQLTFSAGNNVWNQFPAWSPDGKQIAYQSTKCNEYQNCPDTLYLLDVGTGATTKVADSAVSPDWSPDGEWIVFSRRMAKKDVFDKRCYGLSGVELLYTIHPDGSGEACVGVLREAYDPSWST